MNDVTIIFEVKAQTVVGEEICIVGGNDRFGNWDPRSAPKLVATPESYPLWSIIIPLPHGTQYLIRNTNTNEVRWETFPTNRKVESKSPWLLVYDGKFGKRSEHSYLATPSSFVSLRKEAKKPAPTTPRRQQRFQNMEIIREIEELKELLQEKEQQIEQLTCDLEEMETDRLKEIARSAKKTLQRTNHVLMERLENETKKLVANNMCALCSSKIDTVIVCHVCVSKIRGKCLTCHTPIESVHRVYIK